jgi:microcin C transport system substrate-binding protein
MKFCLRLAVLFLIFAAQSVIAAPIHGLSIYGPNGLKYKPNQPYDFSNPSAPKGGYLTLSSYGAFTKLNPMSLKGLMAPGIRTLVFESPMDGSSDDDEPFSQYGKLVDTVEIAKDRMTMIYHIRKNAKFSDGHPVTADDFVFSFKLLQDPEYDPFYKQYFKDISNVKKLDSHKVEYTFAIFNQELPLITGQMPILPKHIYGEPGKSFGSDFDEIAVGSGPYIVEKYDFGKYITLKRNPNWWGKDLPINKGRYNFDHITWKIYLDPIAIREAFKGGEIDANQISSSRDWALDYKGDFVKKGYYIRDQIPHKRVAGMQGYGMNLRNDIFKSRKIRAAISMVFDFDWSNKNLFYGQYTRNDCYFDNNLEMKPQGAPQGAVKKILLDLRKKHGSAIPKTALTKPVGAPGQGQSLEKNIAVANKLLDSTGWKIGKDGIREKNGKKFNIELLLNNPLWQRISEPYKNNLKKIGVDLSMKLVQPAEYEERLRSFKFDMIVTSYGQSRSPGNEQRDLWGSEVANTPGSRNISGISNPAVDELIELVIAADTRKKLIDAIQALDRVLTHQYITVPHWYISYDRVVYWNRFSRPKKNPSQAPTLNNIIEWWWEDPKKAKALKEARKTGKSLL